MPLGTMLTTMYTPSYSKHDIILVRYPFSDLSRSKVRPAVVVSTSHPSQDILITPLTSKTGSLLKGEFALSEWAAAGLNVATAQNACALNLVIFLYRAIGSSDRPHTSLYRNTVKNFCFVWVNSKS
jgi:hypothetical protein